MANQPPSLPHAVVLQRPSGVYLLTPDWADSARLLSGTETALAAGVRALQYRNKQARNELRREQALRLRELTRSFDALLIVNDDVDLAVAVGADGVHLGREDGDLRAIRAALPSSMLLGASCYNEWPRAEEAAHARADYVAFGSVFASRIKPDAVRAPLALLAQGRAAGQHVVAIGGIQIDTIGRVAAAGAHAAALISAVYDAPDPHAAVRQLMEEFERGRRDWERNDGNQRQNQHESQRKSQ